MSLCYDGNLEKVALDKLDQKTINLFRRLVGLGRRTGKVVGSAGRALSTAGKKALHPVEWLGDQVVNHPTRTALLGVPLGYNLLNLSKTMDRTSNNFRPENVYRY